ncbi:MAG TPA: hypothetical protein VGM37_20910 [Armatimonadota bacterium]|jgi:hypothetical protein
MHKTLTFFSLQSYALAVVLGMASGALNWVVEAHHWKDWAPDMAHFALMLWAAGVMQMQPVHTAGGMLVAPAGRRITAFRTAPSEVPESGTLSYASAGLLCACLLLRRRVRERRPVPAKLSPPRWAPPA